MTSYGTGLGGANVATLSSTSGAQIGTPLALELSGFKTGGLAITVTSGGEASLPIFGGTALVDVSQIGYSSFVPVTAGSGSRSIGIPDNANLVGKFVYAQAAMFDATLPSGWARTNGLKIGPCP